MKPTALRQIRDATRSTFRRSETHDPRRQDQTRQGRPEGGRRSASDTRAIPRCRRRTVAGEAILIPAAHRLRAADECGVEEWISPHTLRSGAKCEHWPKPTAGAQVARDLRPHSPDCFRSPNCGYSTALIETRTPRRAAAAESRESSVSPARSPNCPRLPAPKGAAGPANSAAFSVVDVCRARMPKSNVVLVATGKCTTGSATKTRWSTRCRLLEPDGVSFPAP